MFSSEVPFTFKNSGNRTFGNTGITFKDANTIKRKTFLIHSSFEIEDVLFKKPLKGIKSVLNAISNKDKVFNFNRSFNKVFSIQSSVVKKTNKRISEKIRLSIVPIPPVMPGVVSDIGLLKHSVDNEIFKIKLQKSSASGFSDWQEFVSGDAYFREMLVKLNVENKSPAIMNDVCVSDFKVICDVDDVIDKGTLNIASKETEVVFSKTFNKAPEVNVTSFVTADFAVPQIDKVTKTGFTVRLVKPDGSLIGGKITYYAHGY